MHMLYPTVPSTCFRTGQSVCKLGGRYQQSGVKTEHSMRQGECVHIDLLSVVWGRSFFSSTVNSLRVLLGDKLGNIKNWSKLFCLFSRVTARTFSECSPSCMRAHFTKSKPTEALSNCVARCPSMARVNFLIQIKSPWGSRGLLSSSAHLFFMFHVFCGIFSQQMNWNSNHLGEK